MSPYPSPNGLKPADETWRVFRIMSEFVEGFEILAKLPPSVSVFGSARTLPDHPLYQQAVQLGRRLATQGFAVITGGGPGLMEAANKGAFEANGVSVGLNIFLPKEQKSNPYQTVSLDFRYFFCRKVMFVKYAIAFVCFPGGFGTLDEFFESMTLIQTQKVRQFPVILFGTDYWGPLVNWMREFLLKDGLIDHRDLDLFVITDDPNVAVERVEKFYKEDFQVVPPTFEHPQAITAEGTLAGRPPTKPAEGPSSVATGA